MTSGNEAPESGRRAKAMTYKHNGDKFEVVVGEPRQLYRRKTGPRGGYGVGPTSEPDRTLRRLERCGVPVMPPSARADARRRRAFRDGGRSGRLGRPSHKRSFADDTQTGSGRPPEFVTPLIKEAAGSSCRFLRGSAIARRRGPGWLTGADQSPLLLGDGRGRGAWWRREYGDAAAVGVRGWG